MIQVNILHGSQRNDMLFPKHINLVIEHNPHKLNYQSVEQYLSYLKDLDAERDFPSEASKQEAINQNELWEMVWYPETPVGSYMIAAHSLDVLLAFSKKVG